MTNDNLEWLLNWYYLQCDGDWEHGNGVKIGTIDNPGWYLKVSIDETNVKNKIFEKIKIDRSDSDWIRCFVKNGVFDGIGGPFNLLEIIQIFRDWVEVKE